MTAAPDTQTIRLICVTTSLPDAVKQGCIPSREAQTTACIPDGVEGISLPHLSKPPRVTQIILAEDCACESLTGPLAFSEKDLISAAIETADVAPAPTPAVSSESPVTHVAALKDRNYGLWHGQALRDLSPDALNALLHDLDFAPPEGEGLRQFHARIGAWLNMASQRGWVDAGPSSGTQPATATATATAEGATAG